MEPIRPIEEAIRNKLHAAAGQALHDRVLAAVRRADRQSTESTRALNQPVRRRSIIKNPLARLAGAGLAVALIGVVLHLFTGSFRVATTAYGVTDLPQRIRNAKTMHWRGWFYLPQKGQGGAEQAKQEFDYWFGFENGRYRYDRSGKLWKAASSAKLSPFKARFEARKNSHQMLLQMFGNIDLVGGSAKVGREQIEGTDFDIWECEYDSGIGTVSRIRTWLAPSTGTVGRVLFWQKPGKSDPNWSLVFDLHTIAFDVRTAGRRLQHRLTGGAEMKLDNTKEKAAMAKWR